MEESARAEAVSALSLLGSAKGGGAAEGLGEPPSHQTSGPVPQLRCPLGFAAKVQAGTAGAELGHSG